MAGYPPWSRTERKCYKEFSIFGWFTFGLAGAAQGCLRALNVDQSPPQLFGSALRQHLIDHPPMLDTG
jgi:hypothetical protein